MHAPLQHIALKQEPLYSINKVMSNMTFRHYVMEGVMDGAILLISEVSRVLNLSAQRVRVLSDQGKLPCTRSAGGVRLFRASEVERVRAERELATRGQVEG